MILKQIPYITEVLLHKAKTPYIGWVGQHNLGDEILYEAHQKLFSELDIFHFKRSHALDIYQKITHKPLFTYGILGGGTLINQASFWLHQVQYLQNNNVKLFCLGTGVASQDFWRKQKNQTWTNENNEWKEALSKFLFIGVRGPNAKKDLGKIGITNAVIVGDTALSLTNDTYEKKKPNHIIGINFGLVKYNPIWGDPDKYRNELILVIREMIKKGYTIRVLPVWDQDIESNSALVEEINDKNCSMNIAYDSFVNYSKELQACDFFIGQKLHATIMATMNRVPSIMVEYDPKCREFMASIDMEKFCISTKDFTCKKALSLVTTLIASNNTIQKKIDREILTYKKIQHQYAQKIISHIKK